MIGLLKCQTPLRCQTPCKEDFIKIKYSFNHAFYFKERYIIFIIEEIKNNLSFIPEAIIFSFLKKLKNLFSQDVAFKIGP